MKGAPLPTDTFTVDFARDAARQIDRLAEHLTAAGPDETRQILNAALDGEDGVRVVMLLATASYRAQHHGDPHAALYGQAANDLHDFVLRLDAVLNPVPAPAAAQAALTTTPAPARRTR
jgi:hypothetical protein